MAVSPEISVIEADLAEAEFNQVPFPVLEQWRRLAPVVYNAHNDVYMTFSYRDCARVIGNIAEFDSAIAAERLRQSFGGATMHRSIPRDTTSSAGVWAYEFQRDTLDRRRRQLITDIIDGGPLG